MSSESPRMKPIGWLIGLAVLCITIGVIVGLVAIAVVAKRKQRYRIHEDGLPAQAPVQPGPPSTNTVR